MSRNRCRRHSQCWRSSGIQCRSSGNQCYRRSSGNRCYRRSSGNRCEQWELVLQQEQWEPVLLEEQWDWCCRRSGHQSWRSSWHCHWGTKWRRESEELLALRLEEQLVPLSGDGWLRSSVGWRVGKYDCFGWNVDDKWMDVTLPLLLWEKCALRKVWCNWCTRFEVIFKFLFKISINVYIVINFFCKLCHSDHCCVQLYTHLQWLLYGHCVKTTWNGQLCKNTVPSFDTK